jgi:FixJ family two-component response regulator
MNTTREFAGQLESSRMAVSTSIVFVVDEDISVRESLDLLIPHEGWQPEIFASAQEFLDRPRVPVQAVSFLGVAPAAGSDIMPNS